MLIVFREECVFFYRQKTAYEMRISDWSSDVCASDLSAQPGTCVSNRGVRSRLRPPRWTGSPVRCVWRRPSVRISSPWRTGTIPPQARLAAAKIGLRSEEHTSELQSLMRISYAVFCLKKKNQQRHIHDQIQKDK